MASESLCTRFLGNLYIESLDIINTPQKLLWSSTNYIVPYVSLMCAFVFPICSPYVCIVFAVYFVFALCVHYVPQKFLWSSTNYIMYFLCLRYVALCFPYVYIVFPLCLPCVCIVFPPCLPCDCIVFPLCLPCVSSMSPC